MTVKYWQIFPHLSYKEKDLILMKAFCVAMSHVSATSSAPLDYFFLLTNRFVLQSEKGARTDVVCLLGLRVKILLAC